MFILGLIDSFKGTLSSVELGNILIQELEKKNISIEYIPISDGGEGFLDAINYQNFIQKLYVHTVDPLNRPIKACYLYDSNEKTAYIELAKTAGINLLKSEEYNPYITSTYGAGILINAAIKKGIKNIVVGIGGTCTNDGGSGILEALGVKFYDEDDNLLIFLNNEKLSKIKRIEIDSFIEKTKDVKITVVSDVKNRLLGEDGATYVYAPQKGAKHDDLWVLESNMVYYSILIENKLGGKFRDLPGSGAAGGVGFMFLSMFNSKLISGINYFLDLMGIENYKSFCDFIITGEGKIDRQSLSGKVVFEVVKRFHPVKVITVSAINELSEEELKENGVYKAFSIVDNLTSMEESMKNPKRYFRKLIREIDFNAL